MKCKLMKCNANIKRLVMERERKRKGKKREEMNIKRLVMERKIKKEGEKGQSVEMNTQVTSKYGQGQRVHDILKSQHHEDVSWGLDLASLGSVTPHFLKYAGAEARRESTMYICKEKAPRIHAKPKVTQVSYINHLRRQYNHCNNTYKVSHDIILWINQIKQYGVQAIENQLNQQNKKDVDYTKKSGWSSKRDFVLLRYTLFSQIPDQQKKYPYTWMCKSRGVRKLPMSM